MHLIMLHIHPYSMQYSDDMASFIVNVPTGYMLQDCVAPTGWCNPYQRLDDARAEQYSLYSVSDGGWSFLLSRPGRFRLRLMPAIL